MWGVKVSGHTAAVLNGGSNINKLTPAVRQQVEADLNALGITPSAKEAPEGFRKTMEEEMRMSLTPEALDEMWTAFKEVVYPKEEKTKKEMAEEKKEEAEMTDDEFIALLKDE